MKPCAVRRLAALLLAGGLTLAIGLLAGADQSAPPKGQPLAAKDYRLSGPYTHDNLTVFLVHGPDRFRVKNLVLLPEALEQKKAVINETQSVNGLTVENLSPTESVLILSGDILKGGQQDRFAQNDQIIPPKSGKVELRCYCVEHTAARWMRRLEGADKTFQASPGQVPGNDFRLAGRYYNSQGAVWENVVKAQGKLTTNTGASVKVKESDSSLALSLQVKQVKEATEKYVTKLAPAIEGKKDVIGFAYAVNGKVYCADVYGSAELFRRVWPRMVRATAIEAFAELQKDKKFAPATEAAVRAFMAEAEKGKASSQDVGKDIRETKKEAAKSVLFDSVDQKQGEVIRRNILFKTSPAAPAPGEQRQLPNIRPPREGQQPSQERRPPSQQPAPPPGSNRNP